MHKKLFEESENNEWLHPRAIERQNELPTYIEKKAVNQDNLLEPDDFQVIMNPKVHAQTAA